MKYLILFLLLPMNLLAQDITGIWTGFIYSGENKLPYEIVISGEKEKLTGFALTVFTIDGVDNIGVKTLKLKEKKGRFVIEDDELVYNNYTTPARRVKLVCTLELQEKKSSTQLSGSFTTKTIDIRERSMKSYSGTIELQKKNNDEKAKIIGVLHELDLLGSLSFLQQPEGISMAAISDIEQDTNTESKEKIVKPVENVPQNVTVQPKEDIKIDPKKNAIKPVEHVAKTISNQPKENAKVAPKENTTTPIGNPAQKVAVQPKADIKSEPKELKPVGNVTQNANVQPKETENKELVRPGVKDLPEKKLPSKEVVIVTEIPFNSDSIMFTLYDNGEVDGDTVSVFMNGKLLMNRIGLTASGIRQKIFLPANLGDSILVVMYAENLGAIPPNSGLLVIQDGSQRYNVKFIGDNIKNSAVVLRRKH